MATGQLIGIVLFLVAITDMVVGVLVVAPRVKDAQRTLVLGAIGSGALVSLVLGALFFAGVIQV